MAGWRHARIPARARTAAAVTKIRGRGRRTAAALPAMRPAALMTARAERRRSDEVLYVGEHVDVRRPSVRTVERFPHSLGPGGQPGPEISRDAGAPLDVQPVVVPREADHHRMIAGEKECGQAGKANGD